MAARRRRTRVRTEAAQVSTQIAAVKEALAKATMSLGTRLEIEHKERETADRRLLARVNELADELAAERAKREQLEAEVMTLRHQRSQAAATAAIQAELGRLSELVDSERTQREQAVAHALAAVDLERQERDTVNDTMLSLMEGVMQRMEEGFGDGGSTL